MTQNEVVYQPSPKPVLDLVSLYKNKQLNLNPGFQRESVWFNKDRTLLIDSIIRNYPLPAIFLYERIKDGNVVYDVIDGKQRLETIFMFMGVIKGKFSVKTQLPGDEETILISWDYLKRKQKQSIINTYRLSVIEVKGEISDIISLFVRINSTGKALTAAEKNHAKYYQSNFLKTAAKTAAHYTEYFVNNRIMSLAQINRMKHVELICEIMISMNSNDVINKRSALDQIMGKGINNRDIEKARKSTVQAINRLKILLPEIKNSRFKQISDYYVLIVLMHKYEDQGYILIDKKRNKLARDLLMEFSNGVDIVRDKQKTAKGISQSEELYKDYYLAVAAQSDNINQRKKRLLILDGILGTLFAKKDTNRAFSEEQRRLIWNTSEQKKCEVCHKKLTWDDFTIDHIKPHSRGGATEISNAAILCRKHNSTKGNR
jgi:Restriction endonuclease